VPQKRAERSLTAFGMMRPHRMCQFTFGGKKIFHGTVRVTIHDGRGAAKQEAHIIRRSVWQWFTSRIFIQHNGPARPVAPQAGRIKAESLSRECFH
jgi:hypothetical protein